MSFLTITDKRNGLQRATGVTLLLDKTLSATKEKREQVSRSSLQISLLHCVTAQLTKLQPNLEHTHLFFTLMLL